MNVKRISLMSLLTVVVLSGATEAYAYTDYMYVPAGVWIAKPEAKMPGEMADPMHPRCDLLGGLLAPVRGLATGIGNVISHGERAPGMQQMRATEYIEYPNASGVVVRVPIR